MTTVLFRLLFKSCQEIPDLGLSKEITLYHRFFKGCNFSVFLLKFKAKVEQVWMSKKLFHQ